MIKERVVVMGETGDLKALPGSRPWAIAVRLQILSLLHDAESSAKHLEVWTQAMARHAGYQHLTDSNDVPFKTYEEFCKAKPPYGLGYDPKVIDRIIRERHNAQTKAHDLGDDPLGPHGGDRKSAENGQGSNTTLSSIKQERGADYLTRRIARDRPDILEDMKAGKYDSVRAAALGAGIVRKRISIATEPQLAANQIVKHFSEDEILELMAILNGMMQ